MKITCYHDKKGNIIKRTVTGDRKKYSKITKSTLGRLFRLDLSSDPRGSGYNGKYNHSESRAANSHTTKITRKKPRRGKKGIAP